MGKQRSGQLSNEHVWLHTPRPRRLCGVSNGFQRREGTKGLQRQAQIAASPFTGKLQEAEADMSLTFMFCPAWNVIASIVSVQQCFCVTSQILSGFEGPRQNEIDVGVGQCGSLFVAYQREIACFA